jgi:hypothetical protein
LPSEIKEEEKKNEEIQ